MAVSGTVKVLEWKKSNKWQGERQSLAVKEYF